MNEVIVESFENIVSDERTGDLTLNKVDKKQMLENDEKLYEVNNIE